MTIVDEIVLPWPHQSQNPNSRVHWTVKAKHAKEQREAARLIAMSKGWHKAAWPEGELAVVIDAYPPDRRRRDRDNIQRCLKSAFDGISDAIGVDDSMFVPMTNLKKETRKPGEIRIRISKFRVFNH